MNFKKKCIAFAGLLTVVLLTSGYTYVNSNYVEKVYEVKLLQDESILGVAENYYLEDESGKCFDQFCYEVMKENNNLVANGRIPQVGDVVKIVVKVRK